MLIAPLIALLLGLLTPLLRRVTGRATGWLLAVVLLLLAVPVLRVLPFEVGEQHVARVPWIEPWNVHLAVRLDGLSGTFALLICAIGALILVYSEGYLAGGARAGRVQGALLAFLGAMLGLVLADDVISLFVFWELTSVLSFFLVGLKHEGEASRRAALRALFVTGGGGLALLAGLVMMRQAAVDLGVPAADAGLLSGLHAVHLPSHPWYLAILLLVLAGAFTKSAQVPFHFWLPSAMAAPTPVSAFLHSATMVKAGVYLLARLHPSLGDTVPWQTLVTGFGLLTMLAAAAMAVVQTDLKRLLAFSTVSVLGMLVMLTGLGTDLAIKAMIVLLVAHALYKAALFMVAGNVDLAAGTRDVTRLGGLRLRMPWTAAAGLLAALSMAGAPPMFGFLGKELLYKAKLDLASVSAWITIIAVATNVLLVAIALLVALKPFLGKPRDPSVSAHESPPAMILGPVLLALSGVFVGLVPSLFDRVLGSAAATAVAGSPIEMKLELWHGFNPSALTVVGLSVVTLLLGYLLFRRVKTRLALWQPRLAALEAHGAGAQAERLAGAVLAAAGRLADILQAGSLRVQAAILLGAVVLVTIPQLVGRVDLRPMLDGIVPHEAGLIALTLGGAIYVCAARSRLAAVAGLGVTGAGIAVLFTLLSAPDLGATQIMVEALGVILLVLLFRRLPGALPIDGAGARTVRALIALGVGGTLAVVTYVASGVSLPPETADFYASASLPEAYGRNVVNVILVDFRALDTLGEIFVVAAAGVGVVALIGARRRRTPEGSS